MTEHLDLTKIPEAHLAAFYGLLFSMAAADGSFGTEEVRLIHRSLDLAPLGPASRERVRTYMTHPPSFRGLLAELAEGTEELRWGVFTALYDLALADHRLEEGERRALRLAGEMLALEASLAPVVERYVDAVRHAARSPDGSEAIITELRRAAADWTGAGLPVASAYFAGSVQEMIATERDAYLGALGLGLGFVPGVGVAVAIGDTTRVSVTRLIDTGDIPLDLEPAEGRRHRALEGLARLRVEANRLAERAERARRDGEPVAEDIGERLEGLRALMATRRSALED
ncbi:MAG: TerB family tellurite resistance protein [Planctomycetota bacterium]